MRKGTRIVRKYIAIFLIVLMSINSFGAVVSDNDGSAFITKAEFDSLKNNFQSQIDQYNTSIDSKIDGAIASYLSGINMSKSTQEKLLTTGHEFYSMTTNDGLPTYKYGRLGFDFKANVRRFMYTNEYAFDALARAYSILGRFQRFVQSSTGLQDQRFDLRWMHCYAHFKATASNSQKLILNEVYDAGTEKRGIWMFFSPKTIETLTIVRNQMNPASGPGSANHVPFPLNYVTTSFNPQFANRDDLAAIGFYSSDIDTGESGNIEGVSNAATHQYKVASVSNLLIYDDGNKTADFSLYNNNDYMAKNDDLRCESRTEWANNVTCVEAFTRYAAIFLNGVTQAQYDAGQYGRWDIYDAAYKKYPDDIALVPVSSSNRAPQFGFVPDVTHWRQIDSGNISNVEWKEGSLTKMQRYWPLYFGFPLCQAENEAKIKYHLTFDTPGNYVVYLKYGTFNGTPNMSECIECRWKDATGEYTGKEIAVNGDYADISFDCSETNIVCMKWKKVGSDDYATIELTNDSSYYIIEK